MEYIELRLRQETQPLLLSSSSLYEGSQSNSLSLQDIQSISNEKEGGALDIQSISNEKEGGALDLHGVEIDQVMKQIENLEFAISEFKSETMLTSPLKDDGRHIPQKHWWAPILNNLLLLTLLWQSGCVAILTIIHGIERKKASQQEINHDDFLKAAVIVLIIFQTIHIVIILTACVKLTKEVMRRTVTMLFIAQSYVSIILLFAGLFLFINTLDHKTWIGIRAHKVCVTPKTATNSMEKSCYFPQITASLETFLQLIYFSAATITSTGYGDVSANSPYNYLLTTVEMLVGVIFNVVLFSKLTWCLQFQRTSTTA